MSKKRRGDLRKTQQLQNGLGGTWKYVPEDKAWVDEKKRIVMRGYSVPYVLEEPGAEGFLEVRFTGRTARLFVMREPRG